MAKMDSFKKENAKTAGFKKAQSMAKMDSFKKENTKTAGFKKAQSNVVNLAVEFEKRDIVIGNTGIEK